MLASMSPSREFALISTCMAETIGGKSNEASLSLKKSPRRSWVTESLREVTIEEITKFILRIIA